VLFIFSNIIPQQLGMNFNKINAYIYTYKNIIYKYIRYKLHTHVRVRVNKHLSKP